MEPNDPEQERQLLLEVYSNMSDAELQELAAEKDDLTDLAYITLQDEVKRRGLDVDWDAPPNTNIAEDRNLITIRTFRDLPEALLAKGLLESASIECFLTDDNLVRLDWFISNAIGNIRFQVSEADAEAAIEILSQAESGISDEAQ
jgi:hypothetical protein